MVAFWFKDDKSSLLMPAIGQQEATKSRRKMMFGCIEGPTSQEMEGSNVVGGTGILRKVLSLQLQSTWFVIIPNQGECGCPKVVIPSPSLIQEPFPWIGYKSQSVVNS